MFRAIIFRNLVSRSPQVARQNVRRLNRYASTSSQRSNGETGDLAAISLGIATTLGSIAFISPWELKSFLPEFGKKNQEEPEPEEAPEPGKAPESEEKPKGKEKPEEHPKQREQSEEESQERSQEQPKEEEQPEKQEQPKEDPPREEEPKDEEQKPSAKPSDRSEDEDGDN